MRLAGEIKEWKRIARQELCLSRHSLVACGKVSYPWYRRILGTSGMLSAVTITSEPLGQAMQEHSRSIPLEMVRVHVLECVFVYVRTCVCIAVIE